MNEQLHKKDRRILLALDMNARATESSIAKRVGLSKQLTHYRIKKLEEKQIINSYYAIIDHTKLGLQFYRIALKLENTSKDKEQEIITYLKGKANWMVSVLGDYDIWLAVLAQNEYSFMQFWDSFYEKYGYYVDQRWISLMTRFTNHERSFIFEKEKQRDKTFSITRTSKKVNLDEKDLDILKQLALNARQSSLQIARKINLTERVVRYRIKKLEKEKVILGYRPFLNPTKLNLKYYKIFINLKDSKKNDLARIRTYFDQNPYVVYTTRAISSYDFEIEVMLTQSEDLIDFIAQIKENFPTKIKDIKHMQYTKEHVLSYFPKSVS